MHRIAPSEKDAAAAARRKSLWDTADPFRANSALEARVRQSQIFQRQPPNLRHAHDLLPPRLLSGQVTLFALSCAEEEAV
jgi:hypothetical protein